MINYKTTFIEPQNTHISSNYLHMKPAYKLEDLQILYEIGKGSFGTVFKVKSKLDHQIYVLKKISMQNMSKSRQNLALREVQLLKQINHTNIENSLNIIMEYAEGGDLYQFIQQQKQKKEFLEEHIIWDLAQQITEGLMHLHSLKIIHRDIKAMNIFLTKQQRIKIGDLGVSKFFNDQLMQKTRVGTPIYLAPELIQEQPYDIKVDSWAFGCLVYHLACLQPPFSGHNLIILGLNIVNSKHNNIPKKYSKKMEEFIDSLLTKDPKIRPHSSELHKKYFTQQISQTDNKKQETNKTEIDSTNNLNSTLQQITNNMPNCFQKIYRPKQQLLFGKLFNNKLMQPDSFQIKSILKKDNSFHTIDKQENKDKIKPMNNNFLQQSSDNDITLDNSKQQPFRSHCISVDQDRSKQNERNKQQGFTSQQNISKELMIRPLSAQARKNRVMVQTSVLKIRENNDVSLEVRPKQVSIQQQGYSKKYTLQDLLN